MLAMTDPSNFSSRPFSFSSLHLYYFLLLPLIIMPATTITLDGEEDTRAEKFGDFVFENGVIVRVTETGDLIGNATEKPSTDATTVYNDYDFEGEQDGQESTKRTEHQEETTEDPISYMDVVESETGSVPITPMTYNGGLGDGRTRVDVNVSSYHNYSALDHLFGSLEGQYGHFFTRSVDHDL